MKLVFKFDGGKMLAHEVFERTFTIGRSEECRVSLDSEHFSREHCLIEFVDGVVYVTDLNSKNGVYINHIRLPKKMRVSYDLKLPLYMGECFVTIDTSEDFKDPDHLSLVTHKGVNHEALYQQVYVPRRNTIRPKVLPRKPEKRFLDGKGFLIAFLILLIVSAIHFARTSLIPRKQQASEKSP